MFKRILNIEPPCGPYQSSFFSFSFKGAKGANLAPNEATWFVSSNRGSSKVFIGKLSNNEDSWSVTDSLCVSFPGPCCLSFPLREARSEGGVAGVGVCGRGGGVYLVRLDRCQDVLGACQQQQLVGTRKREASVVPVDLNSKRAPSSSSDVISLVDSDEDDDAPMPTTSQAPSQRRCSQSHSQASGSDIFTALLEQGQRVAAAQTSTQHHIKGQNSQTDKARQTSSQMSRQTSSQKTSQTSRQIDKIRQLCVEHLDVATVWFTHANCMVALSAMQMDNLLLFQLQNRNENGALILAVYQTGPESQTPSLLSWHPINQPSPHPLAPPLALPALVLCHEEGTAVERCSEVAIATKTLYKQLLPPAMALLKVPILLLGFRNGDVMYLPCPSLKQSSVEWRGPMCSLGQCVRGLVGVACQPRPPACRGLAAVGGLGKVQVLLQSQGTSPHQEQLHLGSPVLFASRPRPHTLLVGLCEELRVISAEGEGQGGRLLGLAEVFRGRSLEVGGGVCGAVTVASGRAVLALSRQGSVIVSACLAPTPPPSPLATGGLPNKMAVLRGLEVRAGEVECRLGQCEVAVGEVNAALHELPEQQQRLQRGPLPRVEVVDVQALDHAPSQPRPQVRLALRYTGPGRAGPGWTAVASVTPRTDRLQAVLPSCSPEPPLLPAPPPSERGGFASSPLAGLDPGSVFHLHVEAPAWVTRLPLLLTCCLHFSPPPPSGQAGCRGGVAGCRGGVAGPLVTRVLTIYDFLQPAPSHYTFMPASRSRAPLPNLPPAVNLDWDSCNEHRLSVRYRSSNVEAFVAAAIGIDIGNGRSGNDREQAGSREAVDQPFLATLLRALLPCSASPHPPAPDVGTRAAPGGQLTARCRLPDGCRVTVAVGMAGGGGGEEDRVEFRFVSSSYGAVAACADHLADRMRSACKVTEDAGPSSRCQRLKLEQSRVLAALGGLQSSCPNQQAAAEELKALVEQLKTLNTNILDYKTQLR